MSGGKSHDESPFHRGEQDVQRRLGVRDIEDWARKVVRNYMPAEHREFHASLPFLVVAARDHKERPWVTLLEGADGFVTSPDPRSLVIEGRPVQGDALENALVAGSEIGILGIELSTRRRNRVNGRIFGNKDSRKLRFGVDQSYGNCPQYIREREWRRVKSEPGGTPIKEKYLTPSQRDWINSADTFFIASGYRGQGESATFGMDASHRGGDQGFIRVESETRIAFPDYAGNNHLNTIGNLVLDPRVGLLFIDFETGSLLQLTGEASVNWGSDAVARIPGARRLVTIDIEEVIELPTALSLRWDANADAVRSLRLVEKVPESEDVTSFIFEARDGGELSAFEAGQHLPIELEVPDHIGRVRRTYSLSGGPNTVRYRISVKREPAGLVSRYLHDYLEPGAIIDSRKPAGDFIMTCNECPIALVSAGVGVTPMLSMLHVLAEQRGERPIWFLHGARDGGHHPLAREVQQLTAKHPSIIAHVVYSRPRPEDEIGTDYDSKGHVDGALLANIVGDVTAHYFLCGPVHFMANVQTELEHIGVPTEQVHTESFGPMG
jgi:hypothetical protein